MIAEFRFLDELSLKVWSRHQLHMHMFTCLMRFSEIIDLLFNPSQNLILIMSALMLNSLCEVNKLKVKFLRCT